MNSIQRRIGAVALACAVAAGLLVAPAAGQPVAPEAAKDVVVVSISGYDSLVADINFIGALSGNAEMGAQVDALVELATGGAGLEGLDKTKPWGAVVRFADGNPRGFMFLPITDLTKLMNVIAQSTGIIAQPRDGMYVIEQGEFSAFIKPQGNWAFASIDPAFLTDLPADPTTLLGGLNQKFDLGIRFDVQAIPADFRQMAITALEDGVNQGVGEKQPDETQAQFDLRKQAAETQLKSLREMIDGIKDVTLGFAINSEQKTFLEFSLTAVPQSSLAQQFAAHENLQANFPGFIQSDSAVTLHSVSVIREQDAQQLAPMIASAREEAMKAIDALEDQPADAKTALKAAANDALDVALATIRSGRWELGLVGNLAADNVNVVVGGNASDAPKLENALRNLAKVAQSQPDFPGVTWDAETHQGVKFHTMAIPIPETETEARRIFGERVNVIFGVGEDRFFVAAGKTPAEELKKVIDQSQAQRGKVVDPMQLSISVGKILAFAAAQPDADPNVTTLAELLKSSEGKDHVVVLAKMIPNGMSYRIEIEDGILKAAGSVGVAAQEQLVPPLEPAPAPMPQIQPAPQR